MKKTFLAAFCVVGFLLITGGVILEDRPNPVTINGRQFANAVTINGVIAISVEDLAKAFDATFKQQGTTLSASPRDAASGMATGKRQHKWLTITKESNISTNVITKGGKAFIPLADVVKAFGGVSTIQGNLKPGESISLNFAPNANAAFAVGQ
jgi:hypothetical protein